MTSLVGPVYIAHPYSAPTAELRRFNVVLAAELSTTVNSMGAATISPLQESRGREDAFRDAEWLAHGIALLRACRCLVLPRRFHASIGCTSELVAAIEAGIPAFFADREERGIHGPEWMIDPAFAQWSESERTNLR